MSNLLFQARQLGLGTKWSETKAAYVDANHILGDIVKATPTSKAVGDLAQFMVTENLSREEVVSKADILDFPASVLDFFQGLMGQPFDGFPEPLRSQVLRGRRTKLTCRPGEHLPPTDFVAVRAELERRYGPGISECDVASYIMFPQVYGEYRRTVDRYGDLSVVPTRYFLAPLEVGCEIDVTIEQGKVLIIKLLAIGSLVEGTTHRDVFFELNGEFRHVSVIDASGT